MRLKVLLLTNTHNQWSRVLEGQLVSGGAAASRDQNDHHRRASNALAVGFLSRHTPVLLEKFSWP